MKLAILISFAFAFWITTGYEKTKPSSLKLIKAWFTCDKVAEGTIFCDDFESGLTRATVLTGPGWRQGMIAHIWSADNFLVMDPASGIDTSGRLKSTRYNDFDNLRWLGNKKGPTDLFNDANADKWYCIVAHAKLNTPGLSDGIFEFWIDDKLQAGSYNLNWHGNWNADPNNYMINAVFFENYWNRGSPQFQERYLDNILISSKPIKCNCD